MTLHYTAGVLFKQTHATSEVPFHYILLVVFNALDDVVKEWSGSQDENTNTTIEIYDYEDMSDNEIETMFKEKPSSNVSESINLSAISNDTEPSHANGNLNDKVHQKEESSKK